MNVKWEIAYRQALWSVTFKQGSAFPQEEEIETAQIREALLDAEILESYPEDPRGASCLALGFSKGQPIHVVCGRSKSDWLLIITVYIPREPKWRDPRTRRREGVSE